MPQNIKKKKGVDSETIKKVIRGAGFRATLPRRHILDLLTKGKKPLSVKRIAEGVKKYSIDQATVYRTLNSLVKAGVIKPVDVRHDHAHYEVRDPHDHHHIICTNCGIIADFGECDMKKVITRALNDSKRFAFITDHAIELFGVCKACSKKSTYYGK